MQTLRLTVVILSEARCVATGEVEGSQEPKSRRTWSRVTRSFDSGHRCAL